MKIKDDIRPISYIKSHTADILNQVNRTHRPVYVTQNGEARAVLLDTETYEKMNNAIGLLKLIAHSEKDILEKNYSRQENFFPLIEKRLSKK